MVVNYTIEIKSVGTYSMEVGLPTEDFARDGTYDSVDTVEIRNAVHTTR